MYDVQDYDDPEDFYYDHADEFDDIHVKTVEKHCRDMYF